MPNSQTSNLTTSPQGKSASQQDSAEFQTLKTAIVSSAHALNDTYSGFISPLIPYLIENFALLKVEASLYSFFYQVMSILQPLIGHWADRVDLRKFALIAPATTGIFISLLGVAPNFQTGLLLCLVGGLSSATMHAILPALVGSYSGKNIGKGMSFWMVAGDLGVMFGPIVITAVIATSSIRNTPWLMIGGIVVSIAISFLLKDEPYHSANNGLHKPIPRKELLSIMLPLAGIITMRGLMRGATSIYLPVYMREIGASVWLAGASVSIMQAAGVIGILTGGIAKDKFGFKPVMITSILVSTAATLAFAFTGGVLQIMFLALMGIGSMMILPVGMATVQENFPENRSLANGIYLALMFAINALSGVVTGFLYDQLGGNMTFFYAGLSTFLALPFVFLLPKDKKASTI
jgi:FSR family fosmidomycin resistance protein-like MFS transporter